MARVVVVGSLNMDLVVAVDRHPQVDETIAGRDLRFVPGGKGANQAIAARRMGAEVAIVGRVGDDAFGVALADLQRAEGVDTRHLRTVAGVPSGVALIAVAADSSNTIIVTAGANGVWDGDGDVPLARGDILLVQLEVPFAVVEAALRRARAVGAATILNPSPVVPNVAELLALCDIVVLNEIELAVISGQAIAPEDFGAIEAAAARLRARGCAQVVVTLGAVGAVICSDTDLQRVEGRRVAAIDTTGAGDCFTGALAAGLLQGLSLAEAAHIASVAASISVTRAGASPSMPTLAEVQALL